MFANNNTSSLEAKFSLPSNSFYGNESVKPINSFTFNSFVMPESSTLKSDWKTSKTNRTTFTQSSSRTIVEETFLKKFGPVSQKRRCSTDSKRSLLSLPVNPKNMNVSRNRSNRSTSPDWATCRFSLPAVKKQEKEEHQKKREHQKKEGSPKKKEHQNKERKRRSISTEHKDEELKKENRNRSISPDWITSRFSLAPVTPKSTSSSPEEKKKSPLINRRNSASRNVRSSSRSVSPDWETSRFSLPKTSEDSLKAIKKKKTFVSPVAYKLKTKINKNTMYSISQNTLDKLLPKPEIHLFDIVKYGPAPQHKDDFLFGLNLMRSEVLNKIDLLHYKKKLRNTGMNFIRTFQQPKKSRSTTKNSEANVLKDSEKIEKRNESLVSIEISDQPNKINIEDVEIIDVDAPKEVNVTDEVDKPEEVIQIEDNDEGKEVDKESEKLLEEAIQDFADKFGSEIVEETTEKSNVIDSNINDSILININGDTSVKETVKISETNTFYHNVTKKRNRNSIDSNVNLFSKMPNHNNKRNSLPNIKNIKKNGIPKKKSLPNKKKTIIKVKWPIARKSLLDLRNNS